MADDREFGQISREFASVTRELGSLTEAVSSLKTDVRGLDAKFDKHLELESSKEASLNYKIGKLAGTVALMVSLLLGFAKNAIASIFKN